MIESRPLIYTYFNWKVLVFSTNGSHISSSFTVHVFNHNYTPFMDMFLLQNVLHFLSRYPMYISIFEINKNLCTYLFFYLNLSINLIRIYMASIVDLCRIKPNRCNILMKYKRYKYGKALFILFRGGGFNPAQVA